MTAHSRLSISLPRYDGPFDLLLALIRRNDYPIDALPVAEITGRFLAWVRAARDIDGNLGAEFVDTASWLVLLQSRSLLPRAPEAEESPQDELRRVVLDHQAVRATADFLRNRVASSRSGRREPPADDGMASEPAESLAPTVRDVVEAARQALEAARAARSFEEADDDSSTIEEMVGWIRLILRALPAGSAASSDAWFQALSRDGDRAALLLALLEMSRNGLLLLHQEEDFRAIHVKSVGKVVDYNEYESQGIQAPSFVATGQSRD